MQKKVFTVNEIQKKLEYYCVYQDRCHQEVEKKLREFNLIPEANEKILLHLLQENFLNEERFARSFVRGKFRIKHWGKNRIIRELKFRDISEYIIKQALTEIDENEYLETLSKLYEKKKASIKESNPIKQKQKVYQYLYRQGFESHLISDLLK